MATPFGNVARCAALASHVLVCCGAQGQDVIEWALPVDGAFEESANWSPARVPGVLDSVVLGFTTPYAVTLLGPAGVSRIDLTNPAATLRLVDAAELSLDELAGPGVVQMESPGVSLRTRLIVAGDGLLDTRVELLVAPDEQSGCTLTHGGGAPARIGPRGVVSGAGLLQGNWHNAGRIDVSGDLLDLRVGEITQAPSGRIVVRNGSTFRIDDNAVRGGVIQLEPGSELDSIRGVIDGVTIEGQLQLRNGQSVDVQNDVTFDDIVVHGTPFPGVALLFYDDGAVLRGRLELAGRPGSPGTAVLRPKERDGVGRFAQGSVVDVTWGEIEGRWENDGLIEVRGAGSTLDMNAAIVQSSTGVFRVGEGSFVDSPAIIGGLVELGAGSRLLNGAFFEGARVVGGFGVPSGETVRASAQAVIEGPVVVNTLGLALDTRFSLRSASRLRGDVALNGQAGSGLSAVFEGDGPDSDRPIIEAGVTVHGSGQVLDWLINESAITADGPDQSITFLKGGIRQQRDGILIARNGGTFIFEGMEVEGEIIDVRGGSCIMRRGAFADTAFIGASVHGSLDFEPDATLRIGDGTRFDEPLALPGGVDEPTVVTLLRDATFHDVLRMDAPSADLEAARFEAERGRLATIGPDGLVEGQGEINGPFSDMLIQGTLAPGPATGSGEAVGTMLHRGELFISPLARLVIDVAGPGAHDQIVGDGQITLGGTLRVRLADGYEPAGDASFTVLTQAFLGGRVDRVEVHPPTGLGPAHAIQTDQTLTVVLCAADRDGDGALTIFDFLEYQTQFDSGRPSADLDGDGVLTIFDFLAFQTAFDAGCG